MPEIEPLHDDLWFSTLAQNARELREPTTFASGNALEFLLRRMFYLVQLAPVPYRQFVYVRCTEEEFEHLLEKGDLDAAAAQLAPPELGLLVEGSSGESLDDSNVERLNPRAMQNCTSVARGILIALTTTLLRWQTPGAQQQSDQPDQDPHRFQSEPRMN